MRSRRSRATPNPSSAEVAPGVSRWLPGLRALVGSLLTLAAAVTVYLTHLHAGSEPTTHYLVAAESIAPGTLITDADHARQMLGSMPMTLPSPLATRALLVEQIDELVGNVVVAAMEPGDLLLASMAVADVQAADRHLVTIPVGPTDALGARVVPGHVVDVLATFGTGRDAYTAYVAVGVPVVEVVERADVVGTSLALTIAVPDAATVMAVGHAVRAASMFLSRPGSAAEDERPGLYRPLQPGIGDVGVAMTPDGDDHVTSPGVWDDAWQDPDRAAEGGSLDTAHDDGQQVSRQPPPWWPAP